VITPFQHTSVKIQLIWNWSGTIDKRKLVLSIQRTLHREAPSKIVRSIEFRSNCNRIGFFALDERKINGVIIMLLELNIGTEISVSQLKSGTEFGQNIFIANVVVAIFWGRNFIVSHTFGMV